ncbi:hypothetical protein C3486_21435 [Streptomyces sp. Ru73]|nr:hypothetical protein C3486_21435 [Streptomyces sp. Ru73]
MLSNKYTKCRLGRSDLVALFSLAAGPISATNATVTTVHNSTRWSARSLEDLIRDITSAPGYDDRVRWDNLQYSAKDPAGELEVALDIRSRKISVDISGSNEILVRGQEARIELFLRNRGAEGPPVRDYGTLHELVMISMCMLMIVVPWKGNQQHAPTGTTAPTGSSKVDSWMVVVECCLAVAMLMLVPTFLYIRRAQLKVLEDIPAGSVWSRLTTTEKFSAVGIYATVLAGVAAAVSAVTDVL